MKRLTIYHNAKCSKSKATLEILEAFCVERPQADLRVVNYLETPPSAEELEALLKALGMEPAQVVREHEDRFSELGLDRSPPGTRDEWIRTLVENPILIERPIVSDGRRAVIGRPPENVRVLLVEG